MKKLLQILALSLFLLNPSHAEDIREFELEGISIGDSVLDHFSKSEIIDATKTYYPKSKKYYSIHILVQSNNYDQIGFGVKNNDDNYTILKISGDKYYKNNPKFCLKQLDEVSKDFDNQFGTSNKIKYTQKYEALDDGNSYAEVVDYNFNNNSAIRLWCNFFTKDTLEKRNTFNGFTVSINTNEWLTWLNNEAY